MSSYLLKIVLRNSPNLIWRRFVVPSDISLRRLHDVVQDIMGWERRHPHVFSVRKCTYTLGDYDGEKSFPESLYSLADLGYRSGMQLKYVYHPKGAKWVHDIIIENIHYVNPSYPYPIYCLEGVRACPPESCNGITDFTHFLKVMSDPNHLEYETLKSQFGFFNFDHFDIEKVNRKFHVPNPISVTQYSENEPLRFKVTHSKQEDHLYRLGQKLRQYIK
jgi:hypothetical protein